MRSSIEPARSQERLALHNSLPELLDGLARTLAESNADRAVLPAEEKLAAKHGKHRAGNRAYSLDQVITEYHVLRQVLFEVLEEGEQELSRRERDLIWDVLFTAIRGAAATFTGVRDNERERTTQALGHANRGLQDALGEASAHSMLNERLLRTIQERVEDYAIFSLDPSGNITSWAAGAQKMKQFTADEVLGNHFSMLYPEEGRRRAEPMKHLEIAKEEGRFRGEGLRQRKNGEFFLADVFITPMCEGDRLVGYFKIVADLTERTRAIQERDLSRTRVASLELESELRTRFVATLSHDLRNPLSAAKMSAQRITRQSCGLDQHLELAHRAIQSIDRVDKMVSDLLDASRINAGRVAPLVLEEYDLVAETRIICEEMATVHGDRFRLNAPPSLSCTWDRDGMRRVLENLFSNAIKYGSPTGDVETEIEAADDRILVRVHNLGAPIAANEQSSLFELFRRAESAEAGPRKGWGLGLTLVRGITEAHGGVVKLRSTSKEGTSFILDLPKSARTPDGATVGLQDVNQL